MPGSALRKTELFRLVHTLIHTWKWGEKVRVNKHRPWILNCLNILVNLSQSIPNVPGYISNHVITTPTWLQGHHYYLWKFPDQSQRKHFTWEQFMLVDIKSRKLKLILTLARTLLRVRVAQAVSSARMVSHWGSWSCTPSSPLFTALLPSRDT